MTALGDDLFRAICDATKDAIFIKDLEGTYIYVNPAAAAMFGAPVAQIVGTTDDTWFGAQGAQRIRAIDRKVERGEPMVYEESLELGNTHWVFSTSKTPFRDGTGKLIGTLGVARDITVLRHERDVFEAISKVAPGALLSLEQTQAGEIRWQYATEAMREMIGAADPLAAMHPDDRQALAADMRDANGAAVLRDCRIEHPTRGERWIEISVAPASTSRGTTLWHGFAIEVTDRKATERELREQRDRLAGIAEASPGALYSFRRGPDGTVTLPYASDALPRIYGVASLVNAQQVFERIVPEDLEQVLSSIDESARTMKPWRCEYRIAHPSRGTIWVEGHSQPLRDAGGGITWHGVLTEITDRKQIERELRDERDRFAGIAAASPAALYTYRRDRDGTGRLLFATDAMTQIYGSTPAEMAADRTIMAARIDAGDRPRVLAAIAESAMSMKTWHCEYRIDHPTRGIVWVEGHSTPVPDLDGCIAWYGVLVDITERKLAEEIVRTERDRLATISATTPGSIYTYRAKPDGTFDFPFVAPTIEDVYGLTVEEVYANPAAVFERMYPAELPCIMATIAESAATLTPWVHEFRVRHPRKGEIWINGRSSPSRAVDGTITWHGFLADVTDRKRAEEKLRASESQMRSIVETSPDFLILVDREERIQFINRLLPGFRMEEVIGSKLTDYLPEESQAEQLAAVRRVLETGELVSSEVAVRGAHGEEYWFNTRCGPVREGDAIVGVLISSTDLTPRRRAELALVASEQRYRTLIDVLPDAVLLVSEGKLVFCNPQFVRLMGASSASQLIGMTAEQVFRPDDHEMVAARTRKMRETGEPAPPNEETLVALDGTLRTVSVVATMAGSEVIVVMHDLTERQRAERLLRSVLESVNDAILTIDHRGTILSCNPATGRLFGYEADELLGKSVSVLMPADIAGEHDGYLARHLRGEARLIGQDREVVACRKDGSTFPIELAISSFRLSGKQHFTGVIRDITARKRLEEQFRQAHKMEAFGQLAGGVAHDFNNLLTVIIGATEHVVSELESTRAGIDEEVRASLSDIEDSSQRAAGLTRQLLAFSRKTVLEPKVLDVNTIVRDVQKMLRRLIGEDIRVSTHLAPRIAHVNVDPGQLTQVLLNLAVNARDAMPTGGELVLGTRDVSGPEGSFVELAVTDNGVGMTEEVRARVFQPFFTTKGVGKGMGLGLAVVHGIVTQSGGSVTLESEPGKGATFRIRFPAVHVDRTAPAVAADDTNVDSEATVLVVEDDDGVRRLAVRTLIEAGYRVLVAQDGESALRVLSTTDANVDIVVTDVVMPRMDGRALGELLSVRYPEIKVLYVSGYTDDMLVRRGLQAEEVDFLSKPYTPASLTRAVHRVLAAS